MEQSEQLQQMINDLKSEITQLEKEKLTQTDELHHVQERANQLDIDNNELTITLKQLKDLLEERDQTIAELTENANNNEANRKEIGNLYWYSSFQIFIL